MSDLIPSSGPFEAIRRVDVSGSEYWSARDLMPLLGYDRWENFTQSINRAEVAACNSEGSEAGQRHFRGVTKMLSIGNGAERAVGDRRLTRYACYLVAMNGDPRKPEIAAAQTYFAVKTREAEAAFVVPRSLPEALRAYAAEVEAHEHTRAELTLVKPQAEAWTTLADTGADYSVREAAYILNRDPAINTGQVRLFALLRDWRVIGPGNKPYANHAKHVTLRPQTRRSPMGERIPAAPQVRVTVEGLAYLHKRMGGTEPLDVRAEDGAA